MLDSRRVWLGTPAPTVLPFDSKTHLKSRCCVQVIMLYNLRWHVRADAACLLLYGPLSPLVTLPLVTVVRNSLMHLRVWFGRLLLCGPPSRPPAHPPASAPPDAPSSAPLPSHTVLPAVPRC